MEGSFGNPASIAREMRGQFRPGRDKIVTPSRFGETAKFLWPLKTAAHVASIGSVDERTAKRWLAGEYDPPIVVVLATVQEIFSRRG